MVQRNMTWLLLGLVMSATTAVTILICVQVSSAQQRSPALEITSPPDGTEVAPGDTITVVVTPAPDTTFAQVIIIGEGPIGFSEVKTAQPFDFSLTIPANIRLGTYQLTASGATGPGTGVDSSPITLRVEKPGPVLQLSVQPTQIHFESEGEQMPLRVIGTFSDGTTDITESSRTTYTSNDVDVAKVSETGVVTAVGPLPPGTTEVTTEIVVSHGDQSVVVPVIFRPAKAP